MWSLKLVALAAAALQITSIHAADQALLEGVSYDCFIILKFLMLVSPTAHRTTSSDFIPASLHFQTSPLTLLFLTQTCNAAFDTCRLPCGTIKCYSSGPVSIAMIPHFFMVPFSRKSIYCQWLGLRRSSVRKDRQSLLRD